MIVPKQASATSAVLWIGTCIQAPPETAGSTLDVSVTVGQEEPIPVSLTRYSFSGEKDLTFFHGHTWITDLPVGTQMTAQAEVVDIESGVADATMWKASCRFKTLPTRIGTDRFRLVAASCFDIDTDANRQIPGLCSQLFAEEFPDMTVLLGDQVYLDAPWWQFRHRTRLDPRHHYLRKYWSGWGRGSTKHDGLAPLLTVGANWFIPDDHEFWNNFPHATPLALHSFGNWRHIFRDRYKRTIAWLRRGEIPLSLVEPPRATEWSTWSRAAYELFASFQTPAKEGVVSAGASDPDQGVAPAATDVLHYVDVDRIRFIFLDARTKRSRSARAPKSGFVPQADLDRLIELVRGPDVVFLAMSQPAFLPSTRYNGPIKSVRAFLDFDRGMENYRRMYPEFWGRLVEARSGRPTVFIGGDVQYNDVSLIPELAILQVVSSPMSLVEGLADLAKIRTALFGKRRKTKNVNVSQFVKDRSGTVQRLVPFMSNDIEGLTTLDLTASDSVYHLQITHHPRDPKATAGYSYAIEIEPDHANIEQRLRIA